MTLIHKYNYWKHAAKEAYIDSILPDIVPMTSPDTAVHSDLLPDDQPSNSLVSFVSHDSRNSGDSLDCSSVSITMKDFRIEFSPSASDETIFRILKAVRHA